MVQTRAPFAFVVKRSRQARRDPRYEMRPDFRRRAPNGPAGQLSQPVVFVEFTVEATDDAAPRHRRARLVVGLARARARQRSS